MIENFGLRSAGSAGTEIHLMTADDFAIWQAKAGDAHQGWISAQNFHAKPGKSIYFAASDGRIDFAIGIFGNHAVWDGAALAASLPKGHWQFTAASDDLDAGLLKPSAWMGAWAISVSHLSKRSCASYQLPDTAR